LSCVKLASPHAKSAAAMRPMKFAALAGPFEEANRAIQQQRV
jgi:hypothetical protein